MNENIKEIAERLRGLREIMEFSVEEMAEATSGRTGAMIPGSSHMATTSTKKITALA